MTGALQAVMLTAMATAACTPGFPQTGLACVTNDPESAVPVWRTEQQDRDRQESSHG